MLHTHQTVWGALVTALANNWSELAQTGKHYLQLFLDLQFPGQLREKKSQLHKESAKYNHIHLLKLHPVASLLGRPLLKVKQQFCNKSHPH